MSDGFLVAVLIVVAVLAWVLAKVVHYARLSRKQWEAVDKDKLRKWEDEDD